MPRVLVIFVFLIISFSGTLKAERDRAGDDVERRQKTQIMNFFLSDPSRAKMPESPIAVELFNQAVGHYQNRDYPLAKMALEESLTYDKRNGFAYELLGDIATVEHRLVDAKAHYREAYLLSPREELKNKIEKINREMNVEESFETHSSKIFLIKHKSDDAVPLKEIELKLNEIYQWLSDEFGYVFKQPVTVLYYKPAEFHDVVKTPHWIGGVYDGKIRLPLTGVELSTEQRDAIVAHEMTHAFVNFLSEGKAPPWLNEGLAEYFERQIFSEEDIVLKAAVKTQSLLSLDRLMIEDRPTEGRDPLFAALFYEQAFDVTRFLMENGSMPAIRKTLAAYAKGMNHEEALFEGFGYGILELEEKWKNIILNRYQ